MWTAHLRRDNLKRSELITFYFTFDLVFLVIPCCCVSRLIIFTTLSPWSGPLFKSDYYLCFLQSFPVYATFSTTVDVRNPAHQDGLVSTRLCQGMGIFFYNSIVICSSAKCYSGICDNSFRWNIFRIRFHYNILHVFKPHWQETTQGHTKNSLLLHIRYNYNFTLLLTIFRFRMIRQVQFFCRFRLRHHFRLMRNPML